MTIMTINDSNYAWLRDPNWPNSIDQKIIDYLDNENVKCEKFFKPLQGDVDSLFAELKGRIKEDDFTVPVQKGRYFYYSYIAKGQDYWVHARSSSLRTKGEAIQKGLDRHAISMARDDGMEEVLLDENKEAEGKEFFRVDAVEASPNHKLLAYSVDLNGSEKYQAFVKDLASGKTIDSNVSDVFGSVVWHKNNQGYFYVPTGSQWRAEKVYYHAIGTKQKDDILIYEEFDKTFWVHPHLSSSEEYLFITTKSGNSNETWYLDLGNPKAELRLMLKRREDHLYEATHHEDSFYIITNDKGKNGRLVKADIQAENWKEVIPHNKDIYLLDATAYQDHLVVEKRILGLTKIDVINLRTNAVSELSFKDEVYDAHHSFTTFEAKELRYQYSSLAQPRQVIEWNFSNHAYIVRKTQEIPSGYDSSQYETKRIWADGEGGVKIPVSLLYRKDIAKPAPLYLYGYGSYGHAIPASFRTTALSLVDRGFVFAIAHIRGGDDLGYEWYESAKFLTKKRTFEDFIGAAKSLIEQGFASAGQITICGGSAGGMLIGYCINAAPELYKAAVLHVPFVDVLATMLDDKLPLTPLEYKEWGNPKDPEYYDYIKSYSPFDNIKPQAYPNIFITSGLNDPRVTYWEPAKFALKLADHKQDNNLLLLKTNMAGGHMGKSGRYDSLKEIAEEYAFILKSFNKL